MTNFLQLRFLPDPGHLVLHKLRCGRTLQAYYFNCRPRACIVIEETLIEVIASTDRNLFTYVSTNLLTPISDRSYPSLKISKALPTFRGLSSKIYSFKSTIYLISVNLFRKKNLACFDFKISF